MPDKLDETGRIVFPRSRVQMIAVSNMELPCTAVLALQTARLTQALRCIRWHPKATASHTQREAKGEHPQIHARGTFMHTASVLSPGLTLPVTGSMTGGA